MGFLKATPILLTVFAPYLWLSRIKGLRPSWVTIVSVLSGWTGQKTGSKGNSEDAQYSFILVCDTAFNNNSTLKVAICSSWYYTLYIRQNW